MGEGEAAQKGIPPHPGLDPTVLAAARAAGVPQAQLERMGELARQRDKLGDGARAAASPLSESEEEDDAGKETEAPAGERQRGHLQDDRDLGPAGEKPGGAGLWKSCSSEGRLAGDRPKGRPTRSW